MEIICIIDLLVVFEEFPAIVEKKFLPFFRGWLLYPNYNYVSWSYAFAVFSMVRS
jgi:hypothetical protein